MKLNGYPNRAEYGSNCFWTIRLSQLIEPKLNLALARLVLPLHKLVGKSMGASPSPPALLPQIVY